MRQVFHRSTSLLLAAALVAAFTATAVASNAWTASVVSTGEGTVVVKDAAGAETTFMPDGVSVQLAFLEPGDAVSVSVHPTDNGSVPRATITRGSGAGGIDTAAQEMERDLRSTGLIRLSSIHFDSGKADIRPDAYRTLASVGRVLTKWPGLKVRIDAYTDAEGSEESNLELSRRRAEAVRRHLLKHYAQLEPSQLTSEGHGEADPIAPNDTPEGMALNRRVEFVVLNRDIIQ